MQNVVLTVHLILAVLLIGVVLLQRSEGGGLGLGGGTGGGVMTGRQAANALTRATWLLAAGFLVTSIALTVIAARNSGTGSVLDRIAPADATTGTTDNTPEGLPALPEYAPPPGVGQPIVPPAASSAPAADTPATTQPVVPAAPAAPAAETAAPATAVPATPAPASPAPVTPAPVSPAPVAAPTQTPAAPVTPPTN
ncbi:preprotein translocase subunit SecG [Paracoccus marinus]|uniref:preprotein translocase subunit SecG n=1 Tax=Paracoccus marinus TaxID=288426 RepID=UPI00103B4D78|nr:preprotein translocase subunit SecG [Paracoccus marinus]